MQVAFITSSLESAKDGVGDYVRALAVELMRCGHSCTLLALNDRHIMERVEDVESGSGGAEIPMLRIPASASWGAKLDTGRSWLANFKPDWICLQFVCFGWHQKGLAVGAACWLPRIVCKYRIEVMMHELGLGLPVGSPVKQRVLGSLQKRAVIIPLLKRLKPDVLHTSNPAYAAVLAHYGFSASILPLFGNIPVTELCADSWLFPILRNQGIEINIENRKSYWLVGLFGAIHSGTVTENLVDKLNVLACSQNRQLVLLSAGRAEVAGDVQWSRLAEHYRGKVPFVSFGELPAANVSAFLNSLDFGIAASPWLLLGKSGSATAMREHGLPTIVPRDDVRFPSWAFVQEPKSPLWIKFDAPDFAERMLSIRRSPPKSSRSDVAEKLLADLTGKMDHYLRRCRPNNRNRSLVSK